MQTLVIMALKEESQGLFEAAGINLFYCGVGSVKATQNLGQLISKHLPKQVLNLGTAGSHLFEVGQLVECTSFVQRILPDQNNSGTLLYADPLTLLPRACCGSADFVESASAHTACDVFDMEAYFLALVCQKRRLKFNSIKYVTDASNNDVVRDWNKNLLLSAQTLLMKLKELKL